MKKIVIIGGIALLLTGCSSQPGPVKPTGAPVANRPLPPVSTPTPSPTVSATPTPTAAAALAEKGKDLAISRDYQQAIKILEEAIKLDPEDPTANLWLFVCHKRLDTDPKKARALAKKVIALSPGTGGARQAQDYLDGVKRPSRTTEPTPEPGKPAMTGKVAVVSCLTKASAQYTELNEPAFETIKVNNEKAKTEADNGKFDACIKLLSENVPVLKTNEDKFTAMASATPAPSDDSDEKPADKNAEAVQAIRLLQAETHTALGVCYQQTGNTAEAKKYLQLASQDKPMNDSFKGKKEFLEVQNLAKELLAQIK